MLEQDQDQATAIRTAPTWDLPRYFNKLISRSCVSLSDSNQVNIASATICNNGKCSSAIGWGSTSCLQCKTLPHKRVNGKACPSGLRIHQSSLVTLLNLTVDSSGHEAIYQLVDRSLLVVEDDVNRERTVRLVQKPINKPSWSRAESEEKSTSQEIMMSFQWWTKFSFQEKNSRIGELRAGRNRPD